MLTRYISPLIVPATMRIASVAPTSTRLRSSLRSTSGASTRCSTRTNSSADAIETAKHPSVAADAQPQSWPSLSARTTGASTERDEDRPHEVDRARAAGVARLGHRGEREGDARRGDAG